MEHLIDKSALVAEIEKLEKLYCYGKSDGMLIAKSVFDSIKNIIDTLEVKYLQEEPVSEDLKEAASVYQTFHRYATPFKAYIDGAKWQKEQFENSRLEHCDSITNEQAELEQGFIDKHLDKHQRIPTFLDAIEYGMNLQKEEMIKNAVDGVVAASAGGDGWVNIATGFVKSEDVNVKFGDKIKIIIIKNYEL